MNANHLINQMIGGFDVAKFLSESYTVYQKNNYFCGNKMLTVRRKMT